MKIRRPNHDLEVGAIWCGFGAEFTHKKRGHIAATPWNHLVPGAGIEPARPIGQRILSPLRLPVSPSGQVVEHDFNDLKKWWTQQGSNLRPAGYEPEALPTELWVHSENLTGEKAVVKSC